MYFWGGKFHSVPQGLKVPIMTLANFITCWFCGSEKENMPPLQFIQPHDLNKKNGKVLISQWRKMIQFVKKAASKVEFMIPTNNNMSVKDTVDLYCAINPLFCYESLRVNHQRRYEGIFMENSIQYSTEK